MKINSKTLGNLTELLCIKSFYELGYSVSIPYGENNRYDFIADVEGKLLKIQVKTSSTKDDGSSFRFSCRSSRTNGKRTINKSYTKSEIDFFATFIKDKCYLVPVEECSATKTIRFNPCDNNQKNNINFESYYRIENQLKNIIDKH
jgi:hypothetical protein